MHALERVLDMWTPYIYIDMPISIPPNGKGAEPVFGNNLINCFTHYLVEIHWYSKVILIAAPNIALDCLA